MNHTDICPLDNRPCYMSCEREVRWRCDQCHIDCQLDACGYYQGPLGVETDRPQIFDYMIVRLLVITIGALGLWAAIWSSAAIVSNLIPPA